jgi:8-oxo-dGTP pyrophosphatase MutT (NUDIX family)
MRKTNKKIYETCSGVVLVRDDKFVLLYDHDKKHYVLPQGHKRKKETLPDTALREIREETGFQELVVIKKLGRYQYHFDQGRKIIYKTIHVYLVKVISDKRLSNTQNANENFTVRLFSFKEAVKMVRWGQDKKYITLAGKFLKI